MKDDLKDWQRKRARAICLQITLLCITVALAGGVVSLLILWGVM